MKDGIDMTGNSFYSENNELTIVIQNFQLTLIQTKNLDMQEYNSSLSHKKHMKNLLNVPPPNPLLPKRTIDNETVKTGFYRKFMYSSLIINT